MITVKTYTSKESMDYNNRKYKEFKDYFLNTEIRVMEIYKIIGVNQTNRTASFIRRCLKNDGLNSDSRWQKIKKGEWLKHE